MQTSNHSSAVSANSESGNSGLNGRSSFIARNGPGHPIPDNFIFEQVDPTRLEGDDDSDGEMSPTVHFSQEQGQSTTSSGLKPGKKTKGRVKIKMEFIENKLRRYTTFSKRKTGIMKKAYELSTLTGTQVMLLVASETGHVYTFATRKLQPMITSDSGKALIQTCLNSPDPPPGSTGHSSLEQRMNPSGFEETELTYSVAEDDSKVLDSMSGKTVFQIPAVTLQSTLDTQAAATTNQTVSTSPSARSTQHSINTTVTPITTFTSQPVTMATHTVATVSGSDSAGGKVTGIPVQLPGLILQTGNGQPVAIPAGQLSVSATSTQPQAIYRTTTGQILTSVTNQGQTTSETTSVTTPSTLSFLSGPGTTAVTPSQIIMYQTPQGVVYATPTPSAALGVGDRIFNFQQPAHAISIPQHESGGQQIITIPVPVSLSSTPQVLQLATAPTGDAAEVPIQHPPIKKSRK